jgi:hypothetical protein
MGLEAQPTRNLKRGPTGKPGYSAGFDSVNRCKMSIELGISAGEVPPSNSPSFLPSFLSSFTPFLPLIHPFLLSINPFVPSFFLGAQAVS